MDGEISAQVKTLRSVVGRKIMEIDELKLRAQTYPDVAERCLLMVDFLEKDIQGYKNIIDDLKDGSKDYTGDIFVIANLPQDAVDLYNGFYLPMLSQEDLEEETKAMALKGDYVQDLAQLHLVELGRNAIVDQGVIEAILANPEISMRFGMFVSEFPELLIYLKNE